MLAMALWLMEPRFAVSEPSLIDDWASRHWADRGFEALVSLEYLTGSPPGTDASVTRYRPAWSGVWNPLTWNTFGGADSLLGANIWNLVRLAIFVIGLSAASFALLVRPSRERPGRTALTGLAVAPVALALATPPMAVTLARLGPTEPLMIGGVAAGGLLLLVALRNWLGDGRFRTWRVGLPLVFGELLWLLGIYAKEASICILVLLPFLYLHLDRRWRAAGLIDRPLARSRAFKATAGLVLVPALHMTAIVANIAAGGKTTYGTSVPGATDASGWIERIRTTLGAQWDAMTQLVQTPLWRALTLALPFVLLAAALHRRRMPWLGVGLALTGWAVMLFQGLGGGVAARYYLPVIVLFGLALAVALIDLPPWFRGAALAGAAAFTVLSASRSHHSMELWAAGEKLGEQAVKAVARLNPEDCRVYHAGIAPERALSLPALARDQRERKSGCDPRFVAKLVQPAGWTQASGYIGNACAEPGWRSLSTVGSIQVLGCRRFAEKPVLVSGVGLLSVPELLRMYRLRSPF